MFYGQCWKCGERWELGTASTCKCKNDDDDIMCYRSELEAAVLVEREACAKVCDARYMGDNNREDMEARRCAEAIRARNNK